MPRSSPAILSFNAGELSPRLDGRIDIDKYAKGCRTLQNFLPLVQGGALKRSGFQFVRTTGARRLVPFQFNVNDACVLSFSFGGGVPSGGSIAVHKNGSTVYDSVKAMTGATQANPIVITANGHGFTTGRSVRFDQVGGMTQLNGRTFLVANPTLNTFEIAVDGTGYSAYTSGGIASQLYIISTPYTTNAEIDSLQFAGQNDVLYIACPTKPPMKLSRFGDTDWTLEEVDFDNVPFSPENLDEENFIGASDSGGPGGTVTLISSSGVFDAAMVGSYIKLREIPEAFQPEWYPGASGGIDLDSGLFRAFQANGTSWEIGDRIQYEGRVYQTTKMSSSLPGKVPPVHDSGIASDGNIDWKFINYGYGYARITAFTDAYQVTASVVVGFPLSTVYSDETCTASATNPVVITTGTAHDWETGDKVLLRGLSGTLGTALNNTLQPITRTGASTFTVPVNGGALAGGLGGNAYRMDVGPNVSGSITRRYPSLHRWSFAAWDEVRGYPRAVTFFEDRLIWAGTESNPQTAWMSRPGRYEDHATFDDDDSALVVTLSSSDPIEWMLEQNGLVFGTAGSEFSTERGSTEPLSAENLNTIRQRSQYGSRRGVAPIATDNVLLFVQRAGRKLRELVFSEDASGLIGPDMTRLADHVTLGLIKQLAFQAEPDRLLWCVMEDTSLACLTYERHEEVTGWHRHVVGGTSTVARSAAAIPHPDGDGDQLWVIVERMLADGATGSVEYLEKAWTRGASLADAVFVDSARVYSGAPISSVSGLWLLRGQSLEVLADGVSVGPLTVDSLGVITLPSAASKIQVGFGYDAVLSPMRIESGSADGTAQGKTKRAVSLRIRLDQTGRGLYMGASEADATEEVPLADGVLTDGDTDLLPWPGGWETDGIIVLKHDKPTPCTITAILPRMQTNDG